MQRWAQAGYTQNLECFTTIIKHKTLFNLFAVTDKKIFKALGNVGYIRNGVGYGFVSTRELYEKGHIEIGFGRSYSGYGDWGGGFDYTSDSILKVIIDREYNIIDSSTHSFYNNDASKTAERPAKKLKTKLGKKLIVKDKLLKDCIETIFNVVPCKWHIGLEVKLDDPEHTRMMLGSYTNKNRNTEYNLR